MGTPRAVYCWKLGGCREENDQSVQRTPVLFSSPPSSALGINRGGSGQATELNELSGLILNGISCSYLNSLTSSLNSGAVQLLLPLSINTPEVISFFFCTEAFVPVLTLFLHAALSYFPHFFLLVDLSAVLPAGWGSSGATWVSSHILQ